MTNSVLDAPPRVGAQTPRVRQVPAWVRSDAPEAIDLAARAGLVLDPWQRSVMTDGLGRTATGALAASKVGCWVPRQNGKGGIIEGVELGWLFVDEVEEIIHSAHEHATSKKAYARMERLCRRTPALHRRVRQYRQTNGESLIELKDGRILEYRTRSKKSSRGFTSAKVVMDEAQFLTAEQVNAIVPVVSAKPDSQIWFFGTPPDDPTAWVYDLKEDGERGTPRLMWVDWGQDVDVSDPEAVAAALADVDLRFAANPAAGLRILEETMQDESLPSGLGEGFLAERLGVWLPRQRQGGGLITADAWGALADPKSRREPAQGVAFSVEVNHKRSHASIQAWGLRADGRGHAELVAYRPGTDWVAGRCAELRAKHDPFAFAVDARGPAGSLMAELEGVGITLPEDEEDPHRGHLAVPTTAEYAAVCGQILDGVARKSFAHTGKQLELNRAAVGAKARSMGEATVFGRRVSWPLDVGPLIGIALAKWAFETRRPAEGGPNLW